MPDKSIVVAKAGMKHKLRSEIGALPEMHAKPTAKATLLESHWRTVVCSSVNGLLRRLQINDGYK
jgi:hypothetical protein